MDGLSAAASGIAVVSLAIQLVNSVREIRRLLQNVSEAPKELRRLMDLLEQLSLILENIGVLVERQRSQGRDEDTAVSTAVLRAMKSCERKLAVLENLVETAKKTSIATNKATRTLGSFRLAFKKKDIEDFESQLHDAVSLLNLTMTTNLSAVHSESMGRLISEVMATKQITTTVTNELVILRTELTQATAPGHHSGFAGVRDRKKTIATITATKMSHRPLETIQRYHGLLGSVFVRRRSQSVKVGNGSGQSYLESCSRSETTWIFMPSFLSRCVEVQHVNDFGSIQASLRTYPLLRDDHPIWSACRKGNLKGIQTLLSKRQVSPYSVNSVGWTLLHYSTFFFRTETCRFLFDLGLNGQEVDNYGRRPFGFSPDSAGSIPEIMETFRLFASQSDDIEYAAFCRNLFASPFLKLTIQMFNDIVHEWVSKENINKFSSSPIEMAMRMLWESESALADDWRLAIQQLIALGADLHKCSSDRFTLLDNIMYMVDHPFDSLYLGDQWLDILLRSGVDVVEYLTTEQVNHSIGSRSLRTIQPLWDFGEQERYLVFSDEKPRISWDWYVDPVGKAFEVLEEFKNFGPGPLRWYSRYYYHRNTLEQWPFIYPDWQHCAKEVELRTASPEEARIARLFEERIEHRQKKKALKFARAQGVRRGPKVPGAWID